MFTEMGNRGWELACMLESPEIVTVGLGTIAYKVLFFFQRPIMQMQAQPTGYPAHPYVHEPPPPYSYPAQPGYPQAPPMYPQVPPSTGPSAYAYPPPSAPPPPNDLPPKH